MDTERLDSARVGDVERAVDLLRAGRLVALPTETVYGLGARAFDPDAVTAIFRAKGRPSDNPLILHTATFEAALPLWRLSRGEEERVAALAARFWPGPLTVVAPRSAAVSDVVTARLTRVGVRVPAHAVMHAVLAGLHEPVAAPSANASGRPSPTTADDVLASLDGRIDAVLDGGACAHGIESTVVDISGDVPRVLRLGALSAEVLRTVLPDLVSVDPGDRGHADDAAPGLRHKHYAPAGARVELVADVAALWTSDFAVLCAATTAARLGPRVAPLQVLPADAAGAARALYAALYALERARARAIVIEDVPHTDAWAAVRDRLLRAAASG